LGGKTELSIKLDKFVTEGQLKGFWIDPRDGKQKPIGSVMAAGAVTFSTPEGWEDALLVLE
jgi:Putative collagen-binding domain of a collagenase